MATLSVRDLTVEYSSGGYLLRPLDRFSLQAGDGELVALLGPSGSGKTTLLSCIAGILRATAGTIEISGTDVTTLQGAALAHHRRRTVGIVFQAFNLISGISALENVATPLRLSGWRAAPARARARELLEQVDLGERLHHRPAKLSGGQQQRVAIARALALEPTILLADEPTAHLDHVQVEGVLRLLRSIASPGRVVLVATHDDRMSMLADRSAEMAPEPAGAGGGGPIELAPGEVLFEQGSRGHLVFEVASGEIEILRVAGDRSEELLRVLRPGEYFGELGPLLGLPRSATARARGATVVVGRTVAEFRKRPAVAAPPQPPPAEGAAHQPGADATSATEPMDGVVNEMVAVARTAQAGFEGWSEERVDALLGEMALAVAARADALAKATVAGTGVGAARDKARTIRIASAGVYSSLAGRPGAGVVADDRVSRVREVASAIGVIFSVLPSHEPVSTYINHALIALKGRNAIILSAGEASQGAATQAEDIVKSVVAAHGAPQGLIQLVPHHPSRSPTLQFVRHPHIGLVLAGDDPTLVGAARDSGTPAIAPSRSNTPVWICNDAHPQRVALCVLESKGFDHGLASGAEQHLVIDHSVRAAVISALSDAGTLVLDPAASKEFARAAFTTEGHLRSEHVGKPAAKIAFATGLATARPVHLIAMSAEAGCTDLPFVSERPAPIVSIHVVEGEGDALALCRRLLSLAEAGHTGVVHTGDAGRVDRFASAMPVWRVLVNVPAAQGAAGIVTGLLPSATPTVGGTCSGSNLGFRDLLRVKQVAGLQLSTLLDTKRLTGT